MPSTAPALPETIENIVGGRLKMAGIGQVALVDDVFEGPRFRDALPQQPTHS